MVSKQVRFEVFKRDNFKCRYCGADASNATLEIDHVKPRSNGGGDEIHNLVTACSACNTGKGKIEIGSPRIKRWPKTYRIKESVYRRAKKNCKRNGVTLSNLIERFIEAIAEGHEIKINGIVIYPLKEISKDATISKRS